MGKIIEMKAIELYIKYWENWHKQWFHQLQHSGIRKIGNWKLPCDSKGRFYTGNQDNCIHKYFPEPYLHKGKGKKENAKYIFLNINPGGGGDLQDFDKKDNSELYIFYKDANQSYEDTINKLLTTDKISGKINKTAEWYNKRVKWTESIFSADKVEEGSVLCADLIPWHSKKESDVIDYISQNYKDIFKRVLEPLIEIAIETDCDNPKIFIRGVAFFNLINTWLSDTTERLNKAVEKLKESQKGVKKISEWETKLEDFKDLRKKEKESIEQYIVMDTKDKFFDKFNSYLAKYKFTLNNKSVNFYIFSGGANMDLPNAEYSVLPILNTKKIKPLTLREFINDSSHNNVQAP